MSSKVDDTVYFECCKISPLQGVEKKKKKRKSLKAQKRIAKKKGKSSPKVEKENDEEVCHLADIVHHLYQQLEESETHFLKSAIFDFRILLSNTILRKVGCEDKPDFANLPTAFAEAWSLFKQGKSIEASDHFMAVLTAPVIHLLNNIASAGKDQSDNPMSSQVTPSEYQEDLITEASPAIHSFQ